ncbi:type II-B CRISPR-associated RNA-guided endonuclease Cas9/Csx12 [Vibrio rarus]|uniref:type II-B CRISPR-associated RNA-guided endonuclease Cas9/Csx12 n=1 Tax=Vibrio rarus TaxID=413403 RepID=UPI0021C2B641|nr:type II-B CRISPR-associated RNA-guided endonuclease Cas9/Csx12 [Vibrio rarus]
MTLISPIVLDMGSKYTGVYLTQYQAGEALEQAVKSGSVVMHTDNIQYSQAERTARRHQTRAAKRRKMAKRLLWLILEKHYQLPQSLLTKLQVEAINSLLNRRGFTYLSEDVDEALLARTSSNPFAESFIASIPLNTNLFEVFQSITVTVESAKAFKNIPEYKLTKADFKKNLHGDYKEDKATLSEAFEAFKNAIDTFIKAEQDGHKIRGKYLENIRQDLLIHHDYQCIRELLTNNGHKIEAFANLVGHVSNLQLRVLRRYFNDEDMQSSDKWYPQKLHKVFYRNISAMHCKKDSIDKQNQITLFSYRDKSIIDLFETVTPEISIPAFEDQNNRRPPKCQSLLITAQIMKNEKYLPRWTAIVPKLVEEIENHGIDIGSGLDLSSIKNEQQWAQALQRCLELSALHDPFQLRAWVGKDKEYGEFVTRAKDRLARLLNGQFDAFVQFVQTFYQETNASRSALWFSSADNLLSVCNTKPPHKANQLNELISGALSCEVDDEKVVVLNNLWRENPRVGKRGVKGWCKFAADCQKEYGNAFNHKMKQNRWLKENKKKVEDKKLLELDEATSKVAELIANRLGISAQRFNNIFDLAKLYNLLEQDQKGFSKNCRACTKENQWRSTIHQGTDYRGRSQEGAFALRLPADTTRPFDGLLARLMDKQAYKIALAKIEQLPAESVGQTITIPIILEENRFNFTADLHSIKKNSKKSQDSAKRAEKEEGQWLEKTDRIKQASKGICPYTGTALSLGGEIDHIISRAESRGRNKGVFNHEANLIYCSTQGNSLKDRSYYSLSDLHDSYLHKQFGHHDRQAIEEIIIANCQGVLGQDIIGFDKLEPEIQRSIRHGLFVESLRTELMRLLHQSNKTRVNGTQAFLAKLIMQKIKQLYNVNQISFDVAYIQADLASQERDLLSTAHPEYEKKKLQPVASHMIDAAMVMAQALKQPHTRDILQTAGLEGSDWLKKLIPDNAKVVRIESKLKYEKDSISSKQLFKDGLYSEHFMPLIVMQDKLGIGFNTNNVSWLLDAEAPQIWWQALFPYLNKAKKDLNQIQQTVGKGFKAFSVNKSCAFELLEKVAKQSCSESELLAADLLGALYYTTQKTNLRTAIYDDMKKMYAKAVDLTNAKHFTIKFEPKSSYLNSKSKKVSKKSLHYPGMAHWQKLSQMTFIQTNQGSKQPFDDVEFNALIQEVFPQTKLNTRSHKGIRKQWSLPRISKASGAYRARRKNADGTDIWQLFAVEGLGASGFSHDNGVINFSEDGSVPIRQIEQSNKLTPVGNRYAQRELLEPFNAWREIDLEGIRENVCKSVYLSTNSKSRFRVAVDIGYQEFNELVVPMLQDTEGLDHWSKLSAELKLAKPREWLDKFGELLGKPRSNLFIVNLGEIITLEYIVESSNKVMKQAYQNGTPVVR